MNVLKSAAKRQDRPLLTQQPDSVQGEDFQTFSA